MTSELIKAGAAVAGAVSSIFGFVTGRASRAGKKSAELQALRAEVEELRAARIEHTATLAAHTALYEAMGRALATLDRDVKRLNAENSNLRGRLGLDAT